MKTHSFEVKSKSEIVGYAEVAEFDSLSEATQNLGEEKCLELINSQHKTNEMNRVRATATGKPNKKWLRSQALTEITPDEWAQIAGDQAKIEAKIEEKITQIESRMATAPAETEEEGGN